MVFMRPNGFPDRVMHIYGHHNPELNVFQKGVNWLLVHLSEQTFFWRPRCYLVLTVLLIGACLHFPPWSGSRLPSLPRADLPMKAGCSYSPRTLLFRSSHYMIYTSVLALLLLLKMLPHRKEAALKPIAIPH